MAKKYVDLKRADWGTYFSGDDDDIPPFICENFIRDYIFGYTPKRIRLWIVPNQRGNIKITFPNERDHGEILWHIGEYGGSTYVNFDKFWKEAGSPVRFDLYAREI